MKPNISSALCARPSTREPGSARRSQVKTGIVFILLVLSHRFLTNKFSSSGQHQRLGLSPFLGTWMSSHHFVRPSGHCIFKHVLRCFPLVFSSHPPQPCKLRRVDLQSSLLGQQAGTVSFITKFLSVRFSSARWSAAWTSGKCDGDGESWRAGERGASAVGQARVNAPHLPRSLVSSSRQLQMLCCVSQQRSAVSRPSFPGQVAFRGDCINESLEVGTVSRPCLASTRAFGDSITTSSSGPTAATAPAARPWHVSDLSAWIRTRHQAAQNRRGVRSFNPKQDPMGLSPSNPSRFCHSPTIAMALNRRFGGLDSGKGPSCEDLGRGCNWLPCTAQIGATSSRMLPLPGFFAVMPAARGRGWRAGLPN
ncbi:hypothetical protein QBC34DRAFT_58542 [Podospora aff. communis PSN243]|uniref:Uncharacterized protein n=1 Tax=Podospora aff. communis PSN243 TaxID=3040156 RepID=A0AAV9GT10_9PEZI|nr:hypothetical protein QBC34DRAFT_58542 [Podospora aff. communis PSN243]